MHMYLYAYLHMCFSYNFKGFFGSSGGFLEAPEVEALSRSEFCWHFKKQPDGEKKELFAVLKTHSQFIEPPV